MARLLLVLCVLLWAGADRAHGRDPDLWCGACKGLFDEIEYLVSKVHPKKTIDIGSFRIDPSGDLKKAVSVKYSRSETFLTEVLETVCLEMKNYSEFQEGPNKVYRRYQNRPEVKKPLNLTHFGWSVDSQDHLRLACDSISADLSEEIITFYNNEHDKEIKAFDKFCRGYCAHQENNNKKSGNAKKEKKAKKPKTEEKTEPQQDEPKTEL